MRYNNRMVQLYQPREIFDTSGDRLPVVRSDLRADDVCTWAHLS
jgi:hypothetical protein